MKCFDCGQEKEYDDAFGYDICKNQNCHIKTAWNIDLSGVGWPCIVDDAGRVIIIVKQDNENLRNKIYYLMSKILKIKCARAYIEK